MNRWTPTSRQASKRSPKGCGLLHHILAAVMVLMLAQLACTSPIRLTTGDETGSTQITAVIEPEQESPAPPTVEPTALPTPEPEIAPIWVYLSASGNLVFEHPDGVIVMADDQVPIDPWLGLPGEPRYVSLAGGEVFYTALDLANSPSLTAVAPDGATRLISAPSSTGELVDALPSPDGTMIAWLFDTTEVKPTMMEECDSAKGCIGRVYEAILTNGMGNNASTLWTTVIEEPFPLLEIDIWRADSSTLYFRRVPWGVASAYYVPIGGGLIGVSVPDGMATELSDDFLGPESAVSPDGHWLARGSYGVGEFSLTVESDDGQQFSQPFIADFRPLSAQMSFSPDSQQLTWIEIDDRGNAGSLTLRLMSLSDGVARTVWVSDEPLDNQNLPYIGAWLADDILALNDSWGTRMLDLTSGEWVIRQRPIGAEPNLILGLLAP